MELTNQCIAYERAKREGLGISTLTEEGRRRLYEASRAYKKANGIHWNKDCSNEEWYRRMKDDLFSPELEGLTWRFGKIILRKRA